MPRWQITGSHFGPGRSLEKGSAMRWFCASVFCLLAINPPGPTILYAQCANGMCAARSYASPSYSSGYFGGYSQPSYSGGSWHSGYGGYGGYSRPSYGGYGSYYAAPSYRSAPVSSYVATQSYSYEPAGLWIEGDIGYVDMSQYGGFHEAPEPAPVPRRQSYYSGQMPYSMNRSRTVIYQRSR